MTTHKHSMIDNSLTMKVYSCYCDGKNYNRIAQLCLALGIRFCNYSDEYLTFNEDVTDILKENDPSLEFKIYEENWGCLGSEILGYQIKCEYVSVKQWNFDTHEYDETIYHRQ